MTPDDDALRLDKWLWAARFFKTRALAAEAINGGKVWLNGARTTPAHAVRVGDELQIRKSPRESFVVVVADQARGGGGGGRRRRGGGGGGGGGGRGGGGPGRGGPRGRPPPPRGPRGPPPPPT